METNQENCIFCKIVAGEAPSYTLYEDADTLAFLSIGPVNHGHTLVIPKAHYVNAFDMPPEALCAVTRTAQKLAVAMKSGLGTDDVNITMNNGAHAGQVVFHAHMHVIPRYENDGHGLWKAGSYADAEATLVVENIKKAL